MRFLVLCVILILFVSAVPLSFAEHIDQSEWREKFDLKKHLEKNFNNRGIPDIENICKPGFSTFVYLNHTIQNGTLGKICSAGLSLFYFELEADADGYLILDIPKDVFNPRWTGYDRLFHVNVYSTKYVTYDNFDYVDRVYIPPSYDETYLPISYLYDDLGLTLDEYYEEYKKILLELNTIPETEHLTVSKMGKHDNFDRYKIPFLKDDYFFLFDYDEEYGSSDDQLPHNPQKYTMPIQTELLTESEIDRTKSDVSFSCRDNFVPIMKPNNSKIICVKVSTAEKLISRGWIVP